jgi:hypothetical protein
MTPQATLNKFANQVYLTIKNRYFDEIEGEDGQNYVLQVCDWTNMFLDELKNEVDSNGQLVDWWFLRESNYELGAATEGAASIAAPKAIDRLLTDEMRYVQILQDGTVVSNWAVVHPKDITNRTDRIREDMCAVVGSNIVFSREFRDTEANGIIQGDVVLTLPELSTTNIKLLSMVKPKLLLTLGVAKNATLPDIVQGGLSPSFAQKFDNLLAGAVARSDASSVAATAVRDNFSYIRGI